jgi:hypothetical protein
VGRVDGIQRSGIASIRDTSPGVVRVLFTGTDPRQSDPPLLFRVRIEGGPLDGVESLHHASAEAFEAHAQLVEALSVFV